MVEFDITAAYLHSDLDQPIFMKPPHGISKMDSSGRPMVWKLLKSLYGLKQSGHNWMRDLFEFLKGMGLEQSGSDTSLWKWTKNGKLVMILFVHTDDGKIGYSNKEDMEYFMKQLRKRFNVGAEQNYIDRIFNMKVDVRTDGSIALTQRKYIEDLIHQYNVICPTVLHKVEPSDDDTDSICLEKSDTNTDNDYHWFDIRAYLFAPRCCAAFLK